MKLKFVYTFKSLGLLVVFMLLNSFVWGQKTVSGVVKDAKNEPLIGVTISIKGTNQGTVTDFDGAYTLLNVPTSSTLIFSYVGYKSQEVVPENNFLNIILEESTTTLTDVLVIGYGTIKKSDKTGAVTSVTANELNTGRLSDPIEALQGKAAGVLISKQGGDPNAGFSVNIRGAASFSSGTGPLFVVDGVPGVDPTTIAPQDIESYNVLKDASSTSIYGSRGANGVVIITTKNGRMGNKDGEIFSIDYSSQLSFDKVAKKYDLLTGSEVREFAKRTGRTFLDNGADVDWQDEIFRTGLTQDHNLSFTSSRPNSSFRATLSHMNIEGVLKGSSKTRNIGRLNYSQTAFDGNLTINARLSGTIEKNDYVNYGNGSSPDNVIYQALRRSPTDKVKNSDGSFFETDRNFQYFNPLAIIEDYQNERDAKRLLGNISLDINIMKNLKGWVNLAYARNDDESFYFVPKSTASTLTSGYGRRAYNNYSNKLLEGTLTYSPKIIDGHNFSVLGGYSYLIEGFDGFSAQGTKASSDYIKSYNLATLLTLDGSSISGYKREDILISFFGRALYDIKSKYLFSASLRRDGSSKFGKNNQWGWFPSASFGWNMHEENFLKSSKVLDQLKIRLSYGVSGNQNIPSDGDKVLFGPGGRAIDPETGNEVMSFIVSGATNPNPDLKWESNQEVNFGIDFGIFNSRLSGSIELYRRTVVDLIYPFQVPVPPNKQPRTLANSGSIRNQGIELTAQYYVITKPSLKWKTLLTFSSNDQKTIALGDNGNFKLGEIPTLYVSGRGLVGGINNAQVIRTGLSVGTFVMPEYAGLSSDGKFLFYTKEGGVTRDVSKAERRVVGSAQPKFQAGWSNFFNFGNFDASIAFRTIIGYDLLNVTRMVFSNPADLPTLNTLKEAVTEYDRGLTSNPTLSSYYLEDASFLRLDNVSLGYNFNLNKKYIKNLRVYLTATNLFVLTKYSGVDPEISFGGNEFGRDQYDVYPKTRTLTVGFNVKF